MRARMLARDGSLRGSSVRGTAVRGTIMVYRLEGIVGFVALPCLRGTARALRNSPCLAHARAGQRIEQQENTWKGRSSKREDRAGAWYVPAPRLCPRPRFGSRPRTPTPRPVLCCVYAPRRHARVPFGRARRSAGGFFAGAGGCAGRATSNRKSRMPAHLCAGRGGKGAEAHLITACAWHMRAQDQMPPSSQKKARNRAPKEGRKAAPIDLEQLALSDCALVVAQALVSSNGAKAATMSLRAASRVSGGTRRGVAHLP
jgi:hypothetical protein